MKPSGECSSFPFSLSNIIYPPLSHWLRLLRRWLPVCPLLESGKVRVDGLSFYTRLCLNRSTTPFACLHQAVLDSLHQTICLLASGWLDSLHHTVCLLASSCAWSLHHTVCLLAPGSGDDDYEVTGGAADQTLTLGNLLRFERGRFARKPTYYLELWPWQDLHTQDLHTSLLPLTIPISLLFKKKNKKSRLKSMR